MSRCAGSSGQALAEAGRAAEAVAVPEALRRDRGLRDPGGPRDRALRRRPARRGRADPAQAPGPGRLGPQGAREPGDRAAPDEPAPEARDHLKRALALNDHLPIAWNTLGVALYQLEGPAAAIDAWQRAVTLDPKLYDALYNLGLVAAEKGRWVEARQALRQFAETAPPQRFAADIQKAQAILREIGG